MPSRDAGPVMAEMNERLARVETRLDGQGEILTRLERHMESMSDSHAEMAKAVAQIPNLFNQMLDVQKITADQGNRLTALEKEMLHARQHREHVRTVVEPRVQRSHFISSVTAWGAALAVTAVITAGTKGWLE
ncbi:MULTISPECIES: hypothetical protein [unclassified Halomonas]|uniref:hypothetical protein n=1 Tax=unclassified Halomonas TaxID=2609666 RepID=UPI0028881156|nr:MULTISPECIES: hypothetical protein [unclassified Halomonas]MDT0499694.1 hypothetical protein [Halomonas sp. PAR7]MDT0510489.1 hypothetical protein [Halomonas sp. LES1]MDT0589802.1 hypothetical protein [Halomonas sp. PAR8]